MSARGANHVFVNCPFDLKYQPLFRAIVFAIYDCGYVARCALEEDDSGNVRIEKIVSIIRECEFGIHDISRTQVSGRPRLPRFNMPFELGFFLGAREFGGRQQQRKKCLILDTEQYRYHRFLSDIAGQDIRAHGDEPSRAIRAVRDWLNQSIEGATVPGGQRMAGRYARFRSELPALLRQVHVTLAEMTYNDFTTLLVAWLREHS